MRNFIERVKGKYNIPTTTDFFLIVGAFSLAGTTDSWAVSSLLRPFFNILPRLPMGLKVIIYILIAIPLYQFFLLIYGFLLGQFKFVWEREKRLGRWLTQSVAHLLNPHKDSAPNDSKNIQHKINQDTR